jgi:hypothetical protein
VPRRLSSRRQIGALELGTDELESLLEWQFRAYPKKLPIIRRTCMLFCASKVALLERGR